MDNNIQENIKQFSGYFKNELERLKCFAGDPNSCEWQTSDGDRKREYVKTLILTLLDGLSMIWNPNGKKPRVRFIQFIEKFTSWSDGNRVSTLLLFRRLDKENLVNGPLFNFLRQKLNKMDRLDNGTSYGISDKISETDQEPIDELPNTLKGYAISEKEEELIEDYQHFELLYSCRNYLIHEYRSPGGWGIPCESREAPCYFYRRSKSEGTWQLGYPLSFFFRLANEAIDNFGKYLKENNIDPYDYTRLPEADLLW